MNEYLAICSRQPGNALVAAECQHLTGGVPDADGVAFCSRLDGIEQAAYVHTGLRLIAAAPSLPALAQAIAGQSFDAQDFRVDFLHLPSSGATHKQDAILTVADAINADPCLDAPQHHFLIIARAGGFLFGEIIVESQASYQTHDDKPHRTSSSMPAQLARGMVNLARPARSLLDPCCGTGTILIEACTVGMEAFGLDSNPTMANMSRRNLHHFGCSVPVECSDARQCRRTVDAVVTDLPYGRLLQFDEGNVRAILRQMASLAPLGIYVAGQDLSAWLREVGYRDVEIFEVRKRVNMSRYVHRARH